MRFFVFSSLLCFMYLLKRLFKGTACQSTKSLETYIASPEQNRANDVDTRLLALM